MVNAMCWVCYNILTSDRKGDDVFRANFSVISFIFL